MKGLKVNMEMVNCVLLVVILVLVVMCYVKRESFANEFAFANDLNQQQIKRERGGGQGSSSKKRHTQVRRQPTSTWDTSSADH
jgi:hypothetical protein